MGTNFPKGSKGKQVDIFVYVFDRLVVVFLCGQDVFFAKKKTSGSFFFSRKMTTFAIQFGV